MTMVDVCNATQAEPDEWWHAGAEAHAMCVWAGSGAQLLGRGETPPACPANAGPGSMEDKSWMPREWRQEMGVSEDAGDAPRHSRRGGDSSMFGGGFFAGVSTTVLVLLFLAFISAVLTARRRNRMGGAPTMSPARRVGDVVITPGTCSSTFGPATPGAASTVSTPGYTAPVIPTSCGSAPLVINDSAAAAFRADDDSAAPAASRV